MHKQTDEKQMDKIEDLIRETATPAYSLDKQIMNRIGEGNMTTIATTMKRGSFKKTLLATTAAAALGLGIFSTGFISPAMAETLSQIPVIGSVFQNSVDSGLKSAAEQGLVAKLAISDAQEGVTLTVSEAYHDGSRLSIAIERAGVSTTGDLLVSDPTAQERGLLLPEQLVVLVNGEQLQGEISLLPIINGDRTLQKDAALLQITGNEGASLPDQFEVTIQAKLAGIGEAFELQVPVSKTDLQ
ncbi:DUF4179 domain-containing protein [Paenibacillaceae bacterium]|nr:DUF4179 domain-containing protein [Paenibacillaceae bacterium]